MSRVEPERNRYVGHRYVPKIFGEWDQQNEYEGLSIVTHQGNSYTSKKRVPVGIDILNEEFWVVTGNYNAQVEQYRQDVRNVENHVNDEILSTKNYVNDELLNTKNYVDDSVNNVIARTEKIEDKFINEKVTLLVPGDYSTLSLAINKASEYIHTLNTEVEIILQSNYKIDNIKIIGGDFSKVKISSEDSIVYVSDTSKTNDLFYFENCIAPKINILVDGSGLTGRGIYTVDSNLIVTEGSGVMNCDSDNLYATNGSNVTAIRTIFTGGGRNSEHGAGITAWNGSNITAIGSNASNSLNYGVRSAHGSSINFDDGISDNAGYHGIRASQNGRVTCFGASAKNAGIHGIYALNSSQINARETDVTGAKEVGLHAVAGSTINAHFSVANECDIGVKASYGGIIDFNSGQANDCSTYGVLATLSGIVEARNVSVKGNQHIGLYADESASINAQASTIHNSRLSGVRALNNSKVNVSASEVRDTSVESSGSGVISETGSTVNCSRSTVWRSGGNDLRVAKGGIIIADECTTSSNVVISGENIKAPSLDDVNTTEFNLLSKFGYITN